MRRRNLLGVGGNIDYSKQYLTFEGTSGSCSFNFSTVRYIKYSIDDGKTWTSLTTSSTYSLYSGRKMMFKYDAGGSGSSSPFKLKSFSGTGEFIVYGNVMSLFYKDNFSGQTTIPNSGCYSLFSGFTGMISAENLVLPATTLASQCYYGMFCYCSNLSSITCLATDISASQCTNSWVVGVASSGTFTTPSSTDWTTGDSGIPSGWDRVDAT